MKAKLIINVNGEQFQEEEIELYSDLDFDYLTEPMRRWRIEKRCTANEKKVKKILSMITGEFPNIFIWSYEWEAILVCPSRLNELEISEQQMYQFEKQILTEK